MVSSIQSRRQPEQPTTPRRFAVRSWPLVDDGIRTLGILALAIAITILVGILTSGLAAALSAAAIAVVLWRMWIPVVYRFEPQGIIATVFGHRRLISWDAIAGYSIRKHGVLLVPHGTNTAWNVGRCHFVRWCGKRDEILGQLEFYLRSRP